MRRIPIVRTIAAVLAIAMFIGGAYAAPQTEPFEEALQRAYSYVWFSISTQNPEGLFFREATGLFAEAAAMRPGDPEPNLMAAIAYSILGEFSLAEEHYIFAAEHAEDPAVRVLLADFYVSQGRLDEAEAIYREAIEGGYALTTSHVGMGEISTRRGHVSEAIKYLEAAIERDPEHMRGMVLLAEVYLETGLAEQALELLETLDKDKVWHLSYHVQLARVHAELGDRATACYFVDYVTWRDGEARVAQLAKALACNEL